MTGDWLERSASSRTATHLTAAAMAGEGVGPAVCLEARTTVNLREYSPTGVAQSSAVGRVGVQGRQTGLEVLSTSSRDLMILCIWYGGAIQTVDWLLVRIGEGGSAFVSDSGDILRAVRMARVVSVEN